MARNGKIARLPHALRDEVNRRLLDGETSSEILPWLNNLPEVIKEIELHWEGVLLSPQNLSEWRLGGFKDWLRQRAKVESLKTLSNYASELTQAGKGIESGARQIIAGHVLEAMEEITLSGDEESDPIERLTKAAAAIARLSKSSRDDQKLELEKLRSRQSDERLELDRNKFEMQTVAKFLQFAKTPAAQAILESRDSKPIQMERLRELMFGSQGVQQEGGEA